jgi:alpha-aminoadipate carrier protein LysW
MTRCFECSANIELPEDALDGEIFTCPDCGMSLELTNNGGKFRMAESIREDFGE